MRILTLLAFTGFLCAGLLAGCTGHRRDTAPEPDGDTIEVVVKKPVTLPDTTPDTDTLPIP